MKPRPEGKGIERVLPPLFRPNFFSPCTNLVMVVTCFLETGGMRRCKNGVKLPSYPDREFEHLKQDISSLSALKPSVFDKQIKIVLAVNGFVTENRIIKYTLFYLLKNKLFGLKINRELKHLSRYFNHVRFKKIDLNDFLKSIYSK